MTTCKDKQRAEIKALQEKVYYLMQGDTTNEALRDFDKARINKAVELTYKEIKDGRIS